MPVVHSFKVPKKGYALSECEDAYSYVFTDEYGLFSVSDGAGEAAFSREWSNVLVRNILTSELPSDFTPIKVREWLVSLQPIFHKSWIEQVPPYESLPWYGQNKFAKGSSATLLVMRLLPNCYQAFAIGDSCLFHVREKSLLKVLPVAASTDFNTHPYLVHTRYGIPKHEEALYCTEDFYKPGDVFVLATDALSSWILSEQEAKNDPWPRIVNLAGLDDISQMVNSLRDKKEIRNDDVALLIVHTDLDYQDEVTEVGFLSTEDEMCCESETSVKGVEIEVQESVNIDEEKKRYEKRAHLREREDQRS